MTPGAEGQVLRIIRIARVHVNSRYVQNFRELGSAEAVATMRTNMRLCNGLKQLCGGGSPVFGTCGQFIPTCWEQLSYWHKSNKGYKYCAKCAKQVIGFPCFIE